MIAKTCPACLKVSYSAGDTYGWECPFCGEDLEKVQSEPANWRDDQ